MRKMTLIRYYVLIFVVFFLLGFAGFSLFAPKPTQANYGCGYKPYPPYGCTSDDAVCMCTEDGCQWVFMCR